MDNYPINYNILAEDLPAEKRSGPFTQVQAAWMYESLVKMCNAYDDAIDERDKLKAQIARSEDDGVMSTYAYEEAQCPECGNLADDNSDDYTEVSGAPYGRPDLKDVSAHRSCINKRDEEARNA